MGTPYLDEMTAAERRAYTRKLALEIGGELLRSKTATATMAITAEEKRALGDTWCETYLARVPERHRAAFLKAQARTRSIAGVAVTAV